MLKRLVLVLATLVTLTTAARAENDPYRWTFEGRIYLWMPSLTSTTVQNNSSTLSFGDLLNALDFALMGGLEARKGNWSILGDFQYLALSSGVNAAVGPGIPVSADVALSGFIFTGAAGYDVINDGDVRLTPFIGFRYLGLDANANLAVGRGSRRASGNISNFDGIVGLRGTAQLSDRWSLTGYGDIGTGSSSLTWQLAGMINYKINDRWTITGGYRHMAYQFRNDPLLGSVALSGPILGARISF